MTGQLSANDFNSGVWSERVLVITQDYEIRGSVFMQKTGKFLKKLRFFPKIYINRYKT